MSTMYEEVASALAQLRIALKRHHHRPEDVVVCLPMDTIWAIDASMPIEQARATAGRHDRRSIVGIALKPNEERNDEVMVLQHKVRDLQRRLQRREERDRACSVGMAQIMNAVPIADAVGAGENVQTLVDYVIGKMRPDLGKRLITAAEEARDIARNGGEQT